MTRISRFAVTVAVSGGLALAGVGLSADAAQALPTNPPVTAWCPGQALPDRGIRWDMAVCHTYFVTSMGTGNVPMVDYGGRPIDSWYSADIAPPEPNHSARLAVLLSAEWMRFETS